MPYRVQTGLEIPGIARAVMVRFLHAPPVYNMTWEETEEALSLFKKLIVNFYDRHTPKQVSESKELQKDLRNIQSMCYTIHTQRIRIVQKRYR